jgi:hypothetical protein
MVDGLFYRFRLEHCGMARTASQNSKEDGWIVANQCITGDFNGDGRTDIACNYGSESKESIAYRKANGDCPELKTIEQLAAAGCHLVWIWGESLSTGSGFTSSLFTPAIAGEIAGYT